MKRKEKICNADSGGGGMTLSMRVFLTGEEEEVLEPTDR